MKTSIVLIIAILAIKVQAASWDYSGTSWDTDYPDCTGSVQSPIDVQKTSLTAAYTTEQNIQGSYNAISKDLVLLNDGGHTQKVVGEWGTTTWDSKAYTMGQFHFHQPSEHLFDGMRYDMEMHFVHQYGTASDYFVLTAFFEIGPTTNKFLTSVKYALASSTTDASVAITDKINIWDILGSIQGNGQYISYPGSFTTPPCTEGVTFILFTDALQLTKAQWDAFAASLPSVTFTYNTAGNFRPAQTLGNRVVTAQWGVLKRSNLMIASVITALFLLLNM